MRIRYKFCAQALHCHKIIDQYDNHDCIIIDNENNGLFSFLLILFLLYLIKN